MHQFLHTLHRFCADARFLAVLSTEEEKRKKLIKAPAKQVSFGTMVSSRSDKHFVKNLQRLK
jgi:hypothetical protein